MSMQKQCKIKRIAGIIGVIIFVLVLASCGNNIQRTEKKTDKVNSSITLEDIIKSCDDLQSRVNMPILPKCYLRKMFVDLHYTKQEAFDYCQRHWGRNCKNRQWGFEAAWSLLGEDYANICRKELLNIESASKYLKPCILNKLITNNKLTQEEAVKYCEKYITSGKGTCQEKIKEIEDYKKLLVPVY